MTYTNHLKQACVWLVLTVLAVQLLGCGQQETVVEKAPLKPVRTMTVSFDDEVTKSFTGTVDAIRTAELGFRVSGELIAVNVKEGQFVKQGQELAVLDQTDFKITLAASQAEYDRAFSEFNRAQKLVKKGAVSRSDFDKLKAQLGTAQAQLNSAQQNLKYTTLAAPFDGLIAKRYMENYEKVSTADTFAFLQDMSAFKVKINIPESVMIKLKQHSSSAVYAIFNGNQAVHYPLTFKEVSTRADEKNQSYTVTFMMDAPSDITLLPGMSARVIGKLKNDDQRTIYVPTDTVLEDSHGRYVYVVTPQGEGTGEMIIGEVSRRDVVVAGLNEKGIQISAGLNAGDRLVTAGMSKMRQGLVVKLMGEGE